MDKENFTLILLKIIQASAMTTIDILDTITYYGYAETYRRFRGLKSRLPERKPIFKKQIEKIEERQRISKLLYKLKKEGLIKRKNVSKNNPWHITGRGNSYVKNIFLRNVSPKLTYDSKPSQELKIITFDIPESERGKRAWLRAALKNLKFAMLQQSVWIGNTVLPEEFFEDLRKKNLLSHVEIFAVTRKGSLEKQL